MAGINSCYSLTAMTGRKSGTDRTTVIGTVEMRLRTFWIAVIALIPGAILTAITFFFVQEWSFLCIPAVEAAAFYLIERRSTDGLRLRTYQHLLDRKRAVNGVFFLCGQPIEVTGQSFGTIRQITVPVPAPATGSAAGTTPRYFEDYVTA